MTTDKTAPRAAAIIIKKYANRRLYNTATSIYVTLDDLSHMVKDGVEFTVTDARTGEDITRPVLTQIIFEEEGKGTNLLPINFLRQLISFYGNQMQAFVPGYLEMSLETLAREQTKFRDQMLEAWTQDPMKAVQQQTERTMQMFTEAMRLFNPFAAGMGAAGPGGAMSGTPAGGSRTAPPPTEENSDSSAPVRSELEALKEQLSAMQKKVDAITRND